MKSLFFALVCTSFFASAYACGPEEISFEKSALCAKVQWISGPSVNQYSSASVTLSADTDLKLNIVPWMVMGGMEHGSRPVVITNSSPKDYLVEKIYFMGGMMGEWYLKFQLINANKEVVEEVRTLIEL